MFILKNKFDYMIAGVFAVLIVAAVILRATQFIQSNKKVTIEIGGQKIAAEIVRTPEKRAEGLSGRKSIAENAGMLFLFDKPAKVQFWMRDMNFPLDFIWIRGDEIRDLSPNIPADYPGLLYPREEVDKVLEVKAGFIGKYTIAVGDQVNIDNIH